MSIALARKYRPSTFNDLIGQEAVSQTLSLALDTNRLSHAYLFSGLRGSGKTSTARIFAKALICEKGATSKPCEVCSNCIMANESRHIDIVEMDGASNRKIDDIRELIEHTKYKPAVARYKIFIIDEVHMLTKEAFNALLKTLEEPPSFVKFILATTDPLKLPATILSRTQHFRFRKIADLALVQHLEHILNLEEVSYEKEAIAIIARVGSGSVRDALTLLDQAIVYSKNFIDISTVTNMLGIIEPSIVENLIDRILEKDEKSVLEFISKSSEFEAEMVIDEIMLYLKDILLSSSRKIRPMVIDKFFRVLADSKSLLSIGSSGEFVLSLTLFKMMDALEIKYVDTIKPKKEEIVVERIKDKEVKEKKSIIKKEEPKKEPIDIGKNKFKQLIDKLYDRNYELGECFDKNVKYSSFIENRLTWESIAVGDDRNILKYKYSMIRMFAQEIFGLDIKIKNIPKELPQKEVEIVEPISMIEDEILGQTINNNPSEMPSSCIAPSHGGVESAKEKDERTILDEPMVSKALELFAPKKVRVKRNN